MNRKYITRLKFRSAICGEGLGATGLYISETGSQYVTADKPETTAAFPVSREFVAESNPNLTRNPKPHPHTYTGLPQVGHPPRGRPRQSRSNVNSRS